MFRVSQHPTSGVLKTVTAASGTGHNTSTATSLQRGPNGHTVASGWIFINIELVLCFVDRASLYSLFQMKVHITS